MSPQKQQLPRHCNECNRRASTKESTRLSNGTKTLPGAIGPEAQLHKTAVESRRKAKLSGKEGGQFTVPQTACALNRMCRARRSAGRAAVVLTSKAKDHPRGHHPM